MKFAPLRLIPRWSGAPLLVMALCNTGCDRKPANALDFSNAKSVTILMGDTAKEYGTGLQHIYFEKDGLTTVAQIDDVPCRCLQLESNEIGYLYFIIDPTFKRRGLAKAIIEVEYLDETSGVLAIEYDASKSKKDRTGAYTPSEDTVSLTGSQTWRTATFGLRKPSFRNAQNSDCDFRLSVMPPEICVRRVTVKRL